MEKILLERPEDADLKVTGLFHHHGCRVPLTAAICSMLERGGGRGDLGPDGLPGAKPYYQIQQKPRQVA